MEPTSSGSVSAAGAAAIVAAALLAACGGGDDGQPGDPDGATGDLDAPTSPIDAPTVPIDAAGPVFATYRIEIGRHDATITGGGDGNPVRAITTVDGRDFLFAFDPSAAYTITNPTQPGDQLDWNKLPGLSDCNTPDLSVNGAMFGWRWRLDTTPKVLEVTAYANNDSQHLWLPQPLFTLDAAELAMDAPLRYRVWFDGNRYRFAVTGTIGARTIDVTAMHPRVCANQPAARPKWAGQFYFGGTSTAPSVITARVSERPFAP